MRQNDAEVIFVDDNISTMDPNGEFLLTVMAGYAQADNESRRGNIKWGIQKRVNDGSSFFFKRKCYGYTYDENGEMTIYEPEARVVRWIYKSYLAGNSKVTIQKQLEQAAIPSPTGKEKWCLQSIMDILKNEKYYGAVCVYKTFTSGTVSHKQVKNKGEHEFVWYFDHHAPIVSREESLEVQEEMKRRSNMEVDENGKRTRKRSRYSSANITVSFPAEVNGSPPLSSST